VSRLGKIGEETLQSYDLLGKDARKEINALSTKLKSTLEDYGKLARDANGQVGPLAKNIDATLETVRLAAKSAERTLANAEKLTAASSPVMQSVIKTLDELAQAARSLRILADYLERHPESLIQGKGGPKGK
jgi:paraquat-inducible protein B